MVRCGQGDATVGSTLNFVHGGSSEWLGGRAPSFVRGATRGGGRAHGPRPGIWRCCRAGPPASEDFKTLTRIARPCPDRGPRSSDWDLIFERRNLVVWTVVYAVILLAASTNNVHRNMDKGINKGLLDDRHGQNCFRK
jgi:hypothetical protein